ncbi:MAG: tetratricopeptide repeat protein [Syntrophaceae bacterium]|nr:tetratricopeptide repeat protein [Syntrophaceae bacterium]
MAVNTKFHPISIDLNEFKLHIALKDRNELTLHFNSPSRKFYLAVIAFIVNEMKRLGKITSIPLDGHYDLLALLNNTIGEVAGSSDKEHLLPRIYRKWKDILPNLEEAHLFKILGKKKEYDEGTAKTYHFTEAEKDNWANLFEYKGSEENVRLKFAVDRIGARLDDIVIIYEDAINDEAWERFLSSLKEKVEKLPEIEPIQHPLELPQAPTPLLEKKRMAWHLQYPWILVAAIVVIAVAATLAIWKFYPKPSTVKRASLERMVFPLPDKPSVAVLPFVNMSKDPEQDFFSDGLTEEIITTLSKSPNLFVIARSSTSKYKNKPVEISRVSEDLGVRYVLEGSVRRSGEKVRITAQLIDAVKGHHLWTEHFDREIKEVLTVQDEIALKIMKALHVKLEAGQLGSETGRGTKNLEIFLKSMEAREQVLRYTKEGNARAHRLFEEVIALDPNYARGYSGLAINYAGEVWLGTSKNPKESLSRAVEFAEKAVSLDESDATAQAVLAYLFAMTRQYDKAVSQVLRALALDPNSYSVINNCGLALAYSGKYEESLPLLEKAARLNPSIAQSFVMSSMAYRVVGHYDEAYGEAKKAVERNPKSQLAQIALTVTSILTGREEEAHVAAAQVIKINPDFSLEKYGKTLPFKDSHQVDLVIDSLRKAGLM